MSVRQQVIGTGCLIVFVFAAAAQADVVTLNNGGAVHGKVVPGSAVNNSQTVAVTTSTGTLIVFDREWVKQVQRGPSLPSKPAANKAAGAKSISAKPHLTAAQQAWMSKIRPIVARLFGGDRDRSRRARVDLLKIDDPNAIPALLRYLGHSPNEEGRRLSITILRNMPGSDPVYLLVERSLFDPSAQVREDARQGIDETRADAARQLYIEALKTGEPNIASRASIGISEIGDPRREAVPYLIDNLMFDSKSTVMTRPAEWGVLYTVNYFVTPGSKPPVSDAYFAGQVLGSTTTPVYLGRTSTVTPQVLSAERQALANSPSAGSNIRSPAMAPQLRGQGTYLITPTMADLYQQPIRGWTAPPKYAVVPTTHENPAVLDALVKITDQKYPGYGYQVDRWRRWWDAEKKSRGPEQKTPAGDQKKSSPAP